MEKFHFHPKELVYKIVCIYVNLGQRSEFYQALPQDGRSFSLSLMNEAAQIMRCVNSWPVRSTQTHTHTIYHRHMHTPYITGTCVYHIHHTYIADTYINM